MNTASKLWLLAVAATLFVTFAFVSPARGQLKDIRPNLDRGALLNPVKPLEATGTARSFPVQIGRTVGLPTSTQIVTSGLYNVPSGYRLVIEYVTFTITSQVRDDVAVARLRVGTTLNGSLTLHDVMTLGGSRLYLGDSKGVKLYADPGSAVNLVIEREFRPPSTARISISGYLEPVATSTASSTIRRIG